MPDRTAPPGTAEVRAYWNHRIHDLDISSHRPGTPGFFADLDEYHFDKLRHLLTLVDFDGYSGRRVLDVGCGTGVDLVRFARGGAFATGVDIADSAIALARETLRHQSLSASLCVGDRRRSAARLQRTRDFGMDFVSRRCYTKFFLEGAWNSHQGATKRSSS